MKSTMAMADRAARRAAKAEVKLAKAEAKLAKTETKLEARKAKVEAAKRIYDTTVAEVNRLGSYHEAESPAL